jgi:cytochrome c556
MPAKQSLFLRRTLISITALATLSGVALAEPIKERQEAMKNVGKAIGALAAIVKKEAPFDAAVVKENAMIIADNVKRAKSLYPEDSGGMPGETRAKYAIWENKDDFNAKHDDAVRAAMAMAEVTEEAEMGAALGNLGGACKACHEKYRRPKQQ